MRVVSTPEREVVISTRSDFDDGVSGEEGEVGGGEEGAGVGFREAALRCQPRLYATVCGQAAHGGAVNGRQKAYRVATMLKMDDGGSKGRAGTSAVKPLLARLGLPEGRGELAGDADPMEASLRKRYAAIQGDMV